MGGPGEPSAGEPQLSPLVEAQAERRLLEVDLSEWFNPFLPRFARQAIRWGGEAITAATGSEVVGLLLTDPVDRVASVFTRSAAVARSLLHGRPPGPVYAEVDLVGPRDALGIHRIPLDSVPAHPLRHRLRLITPADSPRVASLLREVYGSSTGFWIAPGRNDGEHGLAVEMDGTLAGVAWVLVAGAHARLQGLTVRPGYRRMGLGTDLLFARLLLARQEGARVALSEIDERNAPSRAIAERAGMRRVGRMFLYASLPSPGPGGTSGPTSEARPTSG